MNSDDEAVSEDDIEKKEILLTHLSEQNSLDNFHKSILKLQVPYPSKTNIQSTTPQPVNRKIRRERSRLEKKINKNRKFSS